jgi:antitoxin HicB
MYYAIIEPTTTGFSAFFPDILGMVTTGKTLQQTQENLAKILAIHLEELQIPALKPSSRDEIDLSECEENAMVHLVVPAIINPVSLEIEAALMASGLRPSDLARKLGISRASISRLMNPFYFGQSLESLRRVADAVGAKLTVRLET